MGKDHLRGRTVFITGASSGIGKACAEQFAALGANLLIAARRLDRLEALARELSLKYSISCTPLRLDVRDYDQVQALAKKLQASQTEIDVLINNAGLALSSDKFQDSSVSNWDIMIDTNIKGVLYVTKALLPLILQSKTPHIILIGSAAGHGCYLSGNVYSATKHAVRAISKSLRLDLMGTPVRVSEIDPGAVETEFSEVRWNDKEKAKKFYQGFEPLVAEDIADAAVYCATRPPHVNVAELVVYPQAQASLTDLYRQGDQVKNIFESSKK